MAEDLRPVSSESGGRNDPAQEAPVDASAPAAPRSQSEQITRVEGGIESRERVIRDEAGLAHRDSFVADVGSERETRLLKLTQAVWIIVGGIDGLIGLRVILKLIGANPANEFASLVYGAAALFLAPFFGLTGSPAVGAVVLEIPSLLAILVYALVGYGVVRLIRWAYSGPTTRGRSTYDRFSQ